MSLRPGPLGGGGGAGSWLPLSMLVHCHCPSSEHPGRPARVAQVPAGWTDSGRGTTHSSVVCEFFSLPPSRTSTPTARCCLALPPSLLTRRPSCLHPLPLLPGLDPPICCNCCPDAAPIPSCSLIPSPASIRNLPLPPGCAEGDYRETGHCPTGSQLLITSTALRWLPHLAQREWPCAGLPSGLWPPHCTGSLGPQGPSAGPCVAPSLPARPCPHACFPEEPLSSEGRTPAAVHTPPQCLQQLGHAAGPG